MEAVFEIQRLGELEPICPLEALFELMTILLSLIIAGEISHFKNTFLAVCPLEVLFELKAVLFIPIIDDGE